MKNLLLLFTAFTFFSCSKLLDSNNRTSCGPWQKTILDGNTFKPVSVYEMFTNRNITDSLRQSDSCFFNTSISFRGDSFFVVKTGICSTKDSGIYTTYRENNFNYLRLKYTSNWLKESIIFEHECDSFTKAESFINTSFLFTPTKAKYVKY